MVKVGGAGSEVVAGAPHWQLVTNRTKARRQMPTVHIVTFCMIIHLLSTGVYFVHLTSLFSKVVIAKQVTEV